MDLVGNAWVAREALDRESESDMNSGMIGRVVDVRRFRSEDIMIVTLDLTEFVEYNKMYMHNNYYDRSGVPCLNAYQAGMIGEDNLTEIWVDGVGETFLNNWKRWFKPSFIGNEE